MDGVTVTSKKYGVSHRNIARCQSFDIWFCPNCVETTSTFDTFIQIGDEVVCDYCGKRFIVEE